MRLDYDKDEIGDLFSHPYPHVHPQPGDAPRLPHISFTPECVLIDFLECLYINFSHRAWMAWAKSILKDQGARLQEIADKLKDESLSSKGEYLQSQANSIVPMLKALQRSKKEMPFAFPLDLGSLASINYSCLRYI